MNTSNFSYLKLSVKNGLISGSLLILFSTIIYIFNINMFSVTFSIIYAPVTFGLIIYFMVITMNKNRKSFFNGKITYLECLYTGFVLSLSAMWLSSIFGYILYGLIDTEYMPKQIDKFVEMLQNYNVPEDKIQEQLTKIQNKMNPVKQLISSLYISPIVSLVLSSIISIFIKKKDENFITEEIQ